MSENTSPNVRPGISRFLVLIQFLTASALVLSVRFKWEHSLWLSLPAVGVLLGLWAIAAIGPTRVAISPDLRPNTQLVTVGPYRFVRHPMYTALLLFCGGFTLTPYHWWKVGAWCVLLLALIAKSRIEERQLMERFDEYQDYATRTWRFVPFLW